MLWASSMPCNLPADEAIPIGRYGHLQRRARENGLPHGPVVPLRPAHADHLRHPLQLLAAGRRQRRLLRADPQFPPAVVAAAVSVRRFARGVHHLHRGPRPPAAGARARHHVPAACHFAAHGAPRLPERRAGEPAGELQQPEELLGFAAGGAHQALSGLREDRHPRRRLLQPALDQPAADRERVLQPDPARSAASSRRAPAARAARARRRVRRGAA
jgi:hypothetical protein